MGLDIYLHRYHRPVAEIQAKEAEATARLNTEVCEHTDYDQMSDSEKTTKRESISADFAEWDMNTWGESGLKESICYPSSNYPDDICQIGYIRSSYNSSGMNRRLENVVGKDLYWIFDYPDTETYTVQPNWEQSLERCQQVIDEVTTFIDVIGNIEIREISHSMFSDPESFPSTTEIAMAVYIENQKRHATSDDIGFDMSSYTNKNGEFHLNNPLTVRALIPGFMEDILGRGSVPCVYMVTEDVGTDTSGLEWSLQSLEVIKETILWVLDQPDRDRLVWHWSR